MNLQKASPAALEVIKVSLKLKPATLWASLMFLYVYVDYFHLFMPSKIEDILEGTWPHRRVQTKLFDEIKYYLRYD